MTSEGTDGPPDSVPTSGLIPGLGSVPGPDLGALMAQVFQAREAVQTAQQTAASRVVEGSAGGGAVRIEVTGGLEFRSVSIDPSVIDPAEAELLGDLVLAAIRDAAEKASAVHTEALGGFNLDAIKGLLGGS